MSVGYEGLVLFDTDDSLTGGTPLLCTSFSAPLQRTKIESESLIGGRTLPLDNFNATPFVGRPHVYDWPDSSGSMSFDITEDVAQVMKDWIIRRRREPVTIAMLNNSLSGSILENCFWTSVEFSSGEGTSVSCSVNFLALERTDTMGNDYLANRLGLISTGTGNFNLTYMETTALNPGALNKNPVPFWRSKAESAQLLAGNAEITDWNLSFNQVVERYFSCQSSLNPQIPFTVGIGQVTINGNLSLYVTTPSYNLNNIDTIEELTFYIGDVPFYLNDLDLESYVKDGGSQSEITTLDLSYNAYGLVDPV